MFLSNAVRDVRLLKGMTQRDVSEGIISQGTYSKFEKGTADIPTQALIGILNNLNIDLEEVLFIANGYSYTEEEKLYREFFRFSVTNTISLEEFIYKCEKYLEVRNESTIAFLHQISKFLLEAFRNEDIYFNKSQALHFLDFFSNKEQLFIKDLYIINAIFFLFPVEVAHLTIEYVEKSLKKYKDFQSINRIEVNFRLNYSLMLIKDKLEDKALQQLDLLIPKVKSFKMHYQMAIVYIRKGICLHNLNQKEEGADYIQRGLLILETIEEHELYSHMQKEINKYQLSNK